MTNFKLHELGWNDFQNLCLTVTSEVFGQTVRDFLPNNDAGRDGAFYGTWISTESEPYQGDFVIQAKHTSNLSAFLTPSLISDELGKAERLVASGRCDVYVLMSNARLTGESELEITRQLRTRGVSQPIILGAEWFNRTISENSRLRMLVPRLYGLGDLTQILDQRAYRQAEEVLNSMRTDLAKLVRTTTYEAAAKALDDHGFVLLTGDPMTGKTTLAAELALASADAFDTSVVAIQDAAEIRERWNPDEKQFFWLDDAFGATQVDYSLASSWQRATRWVKSAIASDSKFVLTTREYVLRAAWPHLKPSSFPLLEASRVIVDVSELNVREREQILYNHLKHGRQDERFLRQLVPHLDALAAHPGYTPELARRLADPIFTAHLRQPSREALTRFFDSPRELLESIFEDLDTDSKAALGLVFVGRGWLPSPIEPDSLASELLVRMDSSVGGVTQALHALDGSLVSLVSRDQSQGWVFTHPTMIEAYAKLLQSPEFLHLLISGFTIEALLRHTTCGDLGIENALVIPSQLWHYVMDRLQEPLQPPNRWQDRRRRKAYFARQCSEAFQMEYFRRFPDDLEELAEPGLALEDDYDNDVVIALARRGKFPERLRRQFAHHLIDFCIKGIDPAVLWSTRLRSVLNSDEWDTLRRRLASEVFEDPFDVYYEMTTHFESHHDPVQFSEPLEQFADAIDQEFPDDPAASQAAEKMREMRWQWVADRDEHLVDDDGSPDEYQTWTSTPVHTENDRSIFDDLVAPS